MNIKCEACIAYKMRAYTLDGHLEEQEQRWSVDDAKEAVTVKEGQALCLEHLLEKRLLGTAGPSRRG